MYELNRRNIVLSAAGAAAAFGLAKPITFIDAALAQKAPEAGKGFKTFKVGDIQMTTVYDGIVDRPNAAGFIKNASVDEVKAALKAAGLPENNVPNSFVVPVARVGGQDDPVRCGNWRSGRPGNGSVG